MINRTRFNIEIYGNFYAASGYLKEVEGELWFWDLEIEQDAWASLYNCNPDICFVINDIKYTGMKVTSFYGDDCAEENDDFAFPAANFSFVRKI